MDVSFLTLKVWFKRESERGPFELGRDRSLTPLHIHPGDLTVGREGFLTPTSWFLDDF